MIKTILKSNFKQMQWKNGQGTTTQIYIEPANATIENNNFLYRLSSAAIEKNNDFSIFAKKNRLLTAIKGAGFSLNGNNYEKFEVAQFSGNDKTHCSLLKGSIIDFGIIFDPQKILAQSRILNLKTDMSFSLDSEKEYFFTVLDGALNYNDIKLTELETLHYKNETACSLQVVKSAVLFYLCLTVNNQ